MGRYGSAITRAGRGHWAELGAELGGILVAGAALAGPAWAGSASAPMGVSATVVRSCVISAVAPGSVEIGCVRGATAAPILSSADGTAATVHRLGMGAAGSRRPVVREFPSADGASVRVTVDF
jgi:hypothetical protein